MGYMVLTNTSKRIFIYGMGREGIRTCLLLKDNGVPVHSFIDISTVKQNKELDGIHCISLEHYKRIESNNDEVIVAIKDFSVYESVKNNFNNSIYYKEITKECNDVINLVNDREKLIRLYESELRTCMNESALYK